MARLGREARVLASLNHAKIASTYGLEASNGTRALTIKSIEGSTQIAEAVEYAHERGVIHRDLKAANAPSSPTTARSRPSISAWPRRSKDSPRPWAFLHVSEDAT